MCTFLYKVLGEMFQLIKEIILSGGLFINFWLDRLFTWWIKPKLYSCQIVSLLLFLNEYVRISVFQWNGNWNVEIWNWKKDEIGQRSIYETAEFKIYIFCPPSYNNTFSSWQKRLTIRLSSVTMFLVRFRPPTPHSYILPKCSGGNFSFLLEAIIP